MADRWGELIGHQVVKGDLLDGLMLEVRASSVVAQLAALRVGELLRFVAEVQLDLAALKIPSRLREYRDRVDRHLLLRSEERRVGKECRSRWARDHESKKQEEIREDCSRERSSIQI